MKKIFVYIFLIPIFLIFATVGFLSSVSYFKRDAIEALRKRGKIACFQSEKQKSTFYDASGGAHYNADAISQLCNCGGFPYRALFPAADLSFKDRALLHVTSLWHGLLDTGCPKSSSRKLTGRDFEKLIQVFVRLFFVTFVIFLPAMALFRKERKTVLQFHEKALQGLGEGVSFVVGYSSEEFFKNFSKHFALEGAGRLYFEREAVLFEGSTSKEDSKCASLRGGPDSLGRKSCATECLLVFHRAKWKKR
jgi:hypothetical protein